MEASYRRLEQYLSAGEPDVDDESRSEDSDDEQVTEEDKRATLQFFALLKRQETSRHLVSCANGGKGFECA